MSFRHSWSRSPTNQSGSSEAKGFAQDWKLIAWSEEERKKGQAWGQKTIESFHPPYAAGCGLNPGRQRKDILRQTGDSCRQALVPLDLRQARMCRDARLAR